MFSVIIPTMWYANVYLEELLSKLDACDYIGEIIIIDNNKYELEKTNLTYKKIQVVSMPQNIYVNEAWNLGVSIAKYDNICITNDDLVWDVNCIEYVFNYIKEYVIGMAISNYDKNQSFDKFQFNNIYKREWGWGCCLFINKKNWINIPSDLKIACGDDWILMNNKAMDVSGVSIKHDRVSITSLRPEFLQIQQEDINIFNNKYKIEPSTNNIFFYWDGNISKERLDILSDCIYSTILFNPTRKVYLISNTLTSDIFNNKINVVTWNSSFFENLPFNKNKFDNYKKCSPRDFSDLFRLILLYKFGGSYIDTDDLCIREMSNKPNLICRSYDPHTSFYNNISDNDCVPGFTREIRGYDHINIFPRNDCWQNWEPESEFIYDMLSNEKFISNDDIVWIGGNFSWQSITNETCIKRIKEIGETWNFGLTLLYLFEDFVAVSSFWDRCDLGGEMCDIWEKLPNVNNYDWGFYKCNESVAFKFYLDVISKYPYLSHMWLHSKDQNKEWFEEISTSKEYAMSTWIYHFIKEELKLKFK